MLKCGSNLTHCGWARPQQRSEDDARVVAGGAGGAGRQRRMRRVRAPPRRSLPTMMLLIGMKMSFTKKPMKPMMAKPIDVAWAIFVNSACARNKTEARARYAHRSALASGPTASAQHKRGRRSRASECQAREQPGPARAAGLPCCTPLGRLSDGTELLGAARNRHHRWLPATSLQRRFASGAACSCMQQYAPARSGFVQRFTSLQLSLMNS